MTRRFSAVLGFLATAPLLLAAAGKKADPKKPAEPTPDIAADINKPRTDARKVAFEIDEGTWMSLDVSPDGKTVVFDLLGDLYTSPSPAARQRASPRGRPGTCSRASRPTARPSPSPATAAASTTCG